MGGGPARERAQKGCEKDRDAVRTWICPEVRCNPVSRSPAAVRRNASYRQATIVDSARQWCSHSCFLDSAHSLTYASRAGLGVEAMVG